MKHKLKNYACFIKKVRKEFVLPHKYFIGAYFLLAIYFIVVSCYQYWNVYVLEGELKSLQVKRANYSDEVRSHIGGGVLGTLKPSLLSARKGFYTYFDYLSKHELDQTWLNSITIKNDKATEAIFTGATENPDGLHYLLAYMSEKGPFSKLPLRISEVSSKEEKKKKRGRKKTKESENEIKLRNIYDFTITSEAPQVDDKRKKRRRK